jgi:hypothetical protein
MNNKVIFQRKNVKFISFIKKDVKRGDEKLKYQLGTIIM